MDPKRIGSFICELRTSKNLSQVELAEMIPISREAVSKWERGITVPNPETLLILSNIFDVSVDSLLLGEYTTRNKKEKLQSLTLEMIGENNIKKEKIHHMKIIIICLTLVFLIILFIYYFLNTYNSIKVYTVSGLGKTFSMTDGIFITTREKMYFRFGDFDFSSEANVKKMVMYYQKDGKEKIIFSSNGLIGMIKDYYGYSDYFDLKELDYVLNNTYLKIQYPNSQEIVKLEFTKDFANNKLLFLKRPKASTKKKEIIPEKSNVLIEKIHDKFECDNDVCEFQVQEENRIIEFSYFAVGKILIITEKNEKIITEWIYYIDGNFLDYRFYLGEKLVDEHELYLNKLTSNDSDYKYFQEFQNKYLIKYLS